MANTKKKSFLDSLWFNSAMSVVSVFVLVNHLVTNYFSGDYYRSFVLIIVWVIITFYFVYTTIKIAKKNKKI